MGVRIGCGHATGDDPRIAAIEAGTDARQALDGAPAGLVVAFSSGRHLEDPAATLEGLHEALAPRCLIGCGAGAVLAAGHEFEGRTAVAVWAAALGAGSAETFHATGRQDDDGVQVDGLPSAPGASAVLLLPDPYTFPADRAVEELQRTAPGAPVMGGFSSARGPNRDAVLWRDREVHDAGAVGVVLRGVEVLPCVSQGALPVGPEMTVTAVDGHAIVELDGAPALTRLRAVIEELAGAMPQPAGGALVLGVGVGGEAPAHGGSGYLVRGIIAADPQAGTVTVGARPQLGQPVRLHVRDPGSASRDLHDALHLRREALGGDPAGSLVFTCNGRGRAMFGPGGHDADAVDEVLGGAPSAGFFAAGEIGPVAGASFLHGFTATVAVFAR
jgi:small ligand-binding sensory domain FIST